MRSFSCLVPLLSTTLLAAAPVAAQSLQGRVVDGATGAPIADAQVTLLDAGGTSVASVRSDPSGGFRLAARAPGTFRVSATRLGYRVTLTRELELAAGVSLEVELRMASAPVVLDTAVARVTDGRGVHGRVLDDSTGLPVAGATVDLVTERNRRVVRARTDERGEFSLRLRSAGSFQLRTSAGGFLPAETRALALTPDDTVRLEIRVSRSVVLLAPVTVVAAPARLLRDDQLAGFEWRRRRMVQGRFVGPEQIRHINPFLASDVLQHVPFVRVTGGFRRQALLRDRLYGGFCRPDLYIDGTPVLVRSRSVQYADESSGQWGPGGGNPTQFSDAGFALDDLVSGTTIAAVEVYDRPSAAPPEFPTSGTCGVIVVWTRPPGEDR